MGTAFTKGKSSKVIFYAVLKGKTAYFQDPVSLIETIFMMSMPSYVMYSYISF